MNTNSSSKRIDWTLVFIYLIISAFGLANIYSSSSSGEEFSMFDFNHYYSKQIFFMMISLVIVALIFILDAKIFERLAMPFYIFNILLLLLLLLVGKKISGATSWFYIGGFGIQPSEFAKVAISLGLATYMNNPNTNLQRISHKMYAIGFIILPCIFVLLQPDIGTVTVLLFLMLILFKEVLSPIYLLLGLFAVIIFILTLKYTSLYVLAGISILILIYLFFNLRKDKKEKKENRWKKKGLSSLIVIGIATIVSLSTSFVYNNVFKPHHKDRFNLWLNIDADSNRMNQIKKTIGYNSYQSETAITSGNIVGKGFMEGIRTKGNFIPEQHTDYIYSTVGEEWGLLGTGILLLLYTVLVSRIIILADKQKNTFSKNYGYAVGIIIFVHYFINIGMVIGIIPTIGIPLPFFSYGGSAFISFTVLLFIFIRLDANRANEWQTIQKS